MICKKCGKDKDISEYLKYYIKDKEYVRKECTLCFKLYRSVYYKNNKEKFYEAKKRHIEKNPPVKKRHSKPVYLTGDDIISFIEKVNRQAGYVDYIDAFRLTHIYTILYGGENVNNNMDIEDELVLMWDKLKKYEIDKK